MKKWTNDEKNYAINLLNEGYSYKQIANKLNRTSKSIERKLQGQHSKYREITLYENIICKNCQKEIRILKSEKRIFCCNKCQLEDIIKNKKINYNKTKDAKCKKCNESIKIKNNASISNSLCLCCKSGNNKCKYCGEEHQKSGICDDCRPHIQKIYLFKKLNKFENNVKLNILNENTILFLQELYYNKKYSRLQISEEFKIDKKSLYIFFIKNNFNLRNLSESVSNAVLQGRLNYSDIKNQYKTEWHTTWNNKLVYCRSSYELEYCKILDKNKTEYFMENKKIKYWDSILKKERIAIPDFYLPKTNEIIEIKSYWTFDEQNMKDKFLSYKENGYNVKLILEHLEYKII